MLIVTFDEAESGPNVDGACCGEQPGAAAAQPGEGGPGEGLIGAAVISPFVRPGTVSRVPYNDFSLHGRLRTSSAFRSSQKPGRPLGVGQGRSDRNL